MNNGMNNSNNKNNIVNNQAYTNPVGNINRQIPIENQTNPVNNGNRQMPAQNNINNSATMNNASMNNRQQIPLQNMQNRVENMSDMQKNQVPIQNRVNQVQRPVSSLNMQPQPPQQMNRIQSQVGNISTQNNGVRINNAAINYNVQTKDNNLGNNQIPKTNVSNNQQVIQEPIKNETPKEEKQNNPSNDREQIQAARSYKLNTEEEKKEEVIEEKKEEVIEEKKEEIIPPKKTKKKKNTLARFFFLIILILGAYIGYLTYNSNMTIKLLNSTCSPVSTLQDTKQLDLDSTLVKDLYNKVKTNIREDVAEIQLNNSLKLYLAYRQLSNDKFYESDCSDFDNGSMLPFSCDKATFVPKTFKVDSLKIEYKKLFGETATFTPQNIQIGRNCIGGYQYVSSREEYVQGTCTENITTTYRAQKELKEATSRQSTIILKEEVRYAASEGQILPEYLKNGTYVYVFKLDNNYNYAYIAKYLEQE